MNVQLGLRQAAGELVERCRHDLSARMRLHDGSVSNSSTKTVRRGIAAPCGACAQPDGRLRFLRPRDILRANGECHDCLRNHHRPGSPRPGPHRFQDVLRLLGGLCGRRAQHARLPGVHGASGRAARDQPDRGRKDDHGGPGAQLHRSPSTRSSPARTTTTPTCPRATRSASTSCRSAATAGWRFTTEAGTKRIGITRAHLEEDTGKLVHAAEGGRLMGPDAAARAR